MTLEQTKIAERRAKKQARARRYYEKNRERILAGRREEYAENRQEIQAVRNDARRQNPEKYRAARRRWYAANAEKMCAYNAASKKKHADSVRANNARRRARVRGAIGDLSREDIAEITAAQNGRCAFCSKKQRLSVDHIVPLAKGGQHVRGNIQMLCRPCNSSKGADDQEDFARRRGLLL